MSDQEIKTLEGLKVLIIKRCDGLEKDIGEVKVRLEKIETKLHVTGNGSPGISTRLDRLENAQKIAKENKKNWASWIIPLVTVLIGSFLGAFFASLF